MDVRSFPRLPAIPIQYPSVCTRPRVADGCSSIATCSKNQDGQVSVTAVGADLRKDTCELNVSSRRRCDGDKNVRVSLQFAGNYDARWLSKASAIDSKSVWDSFSLVSYRTKASLVDTEVALLRQLHEAGWTGYTRLAASSIEDPDARHIALLQGGSILTVFVSRPDNAPEELVVQTSVGISNKSLPIPPDAGWIEYDESTNVQLVINTKMDLAQTARFFDEAMAAEGWLARDAGRQVKDERGFLPYFEGSRM